MSESLAQKSQADLLSEKLRSVSESLQKLPISFWRGLVLVVAFIWIAHSASTLFWLLFPIPNAPEPSKIAIIEEIKSAGPAKSIAFEEVKPFKDVFGSASSEVVNSKPVATPEIEVNPDVEETKLNIKLHGVFVSSDESKGSAIIASGNDQLLYKVGEEIKANRGVKLKKVLTKKIIIDNNGKAESLWLFSEDDLKSSSVATSALSRPPPSLPPNAGVGARSRTSGETVTRTVSRDQIPKSIGDVVRFSVHREGGQMVGYRIRPGRDRELFSEVGLKANDIVTSVNGIEVNDPKQVRSVYKSMKTATQAQLSVLRDGITHSITISLD